MLRVEGLVRRFAPRVAGGAPVRALDGVTLELAAGGSLLIAGESGCGKTTLVRTMLRLVEPDEGRILWRGRDVRAMAPGELRPWRRNVQPVFQDSAGALDSRLTAGESIGEALVVHDLARGAARRERVHEMLGLVGLAADLADRRPHELSGGERQRVGLARALAVGPALLVADEPFASLDEPTKARAAELLADLRARCGLSLLLVSHDLRVAARAAERICVLYAGRVAEAGPTRAVLDAPRHPYTLALVNALPEPDPDAPRPAALPGEPPDPANLPEGCAFHPRCPLADARCRSSRPEPVAADAGHVTACFRSDEVPGRDAPCETAASACKSR